MTIPIQISDLFSVFSGYQSGWVGDCKVLKIYKNGNVVLEGHAGQWNVMGDALHPAGRDNAWGYTVAWTAGSENAVRLKGNSVRRSMIQRLCRDKNWENVPTDKLKEALRCQSGS